MVVDMYVLYSTILSGGPVFFSDPGDGGYTGSHSSAPRLSSAVQDIRHGQNYEGKSGQKAVPGSAETEEAAMRRSSSESILLHSDCQWPKL